MPVTPIRSLPYPDLGAVPDVPADLAALANALDTFAGFLRDTLANRPAASPANIGYLFEATDGGFSWSTGTEWRNLSAIIDIFTTSGTWTKRTGARLVQIIGFGGGAPGVTS